MDLREVGLPNAEKHWYFLSKLAVFESEVERWINVDLRILDYGAGDGYFSKELLKKRFGTSNCVDLNYTQTIEEDSIFFSTKIVEQNPNLILFIDVLEHVPNPSQELHKVLEMIKSDCIVLITVPAFQSLWSIHDEFLGHYGRYKLEQVKEWLVGFEGQVKILREHYLYSLIFPLVFIYRKFRKKSRSDLREVPVFVNKVLFKFCQFDNRYMRNRHFGLSSLLVFSFTPNLTKSRIE